MNDNIFWILSSKVKEGETGNLKSLMNEMISDTKEKNPGTMFYEWFISQDDKYCHLFERYKDSESALFQLKSFGKNFSKKFMQLLEIKSFTVYGNPDPELTNALIPLGAAIMPFVDGFSE